MANNLRSIFALDPGAKPKGSFKDDIVGRFRAGRQVRMGAKMVPESLRDWRVTTGDPTVADELARLLGGSPEEWETDKEDNLEVLTNSPSARIIIENADALDASMKLFGNMTGLVHHCDGAVYLTDDDAELVGTPCGCPTTVQERKDRAKSGKGPKPSIELTFKLADAPELGKFRFNSASWSLVDVLGEVFEAIDRVGGADEENGVKGGPVLATLTIEHVEYTTKAGRDVSYNKPVIDVLSAWAGTGDTELPAAA
ncbi:recombination directionality factor [Streptomyces zaomyceticus]|uniref:recombination directionality factor n=1 Tax=Streptomyces zaomyceticus TaxID=68286 RepID=UPI00342E033C